MLVGLAAKNAILIVEFAKVQVDDGEDIVTAAINAARLRFRPILMTSLAFVLGMLPMVLASGPGSASRQAIGTGVFFGMIFAIVLGIILVPFFFVKASNGAMVPLTSLGNASYTTGPGSIKRFNMFTTAVIRGEAAQGYSSGQAMEIMEQIARDHLPDNIGLEWSGLSYQEKKAGGQTGLVMALVFLFVFLFLAAQYESWTLPVAVLLSLPIAALGAYLGVWICGLENDVYFQIGLVTVSYTHLRAHET